MIEPVTQFLTESTVHSFVHLTGERRVYVKLVWVIAFLLSVSYCSVKVSESYKKFVSGEVTSTIKAKSLKFEFPDIYLCNESPISGSYSVLLSNNNTAILRRYRSLVNQSLLGNHYKSYELYDSTLRITHSLPYQFLSDVLAHQWIKQDYLLNNNYSTGSETTVFYHPSRLNCLKLNWSAESQVELKSISEALPYIIFIDPPIPIDVSEPDFKFWQDTYINVKPNDWDLTFGFDFYRSDGFKIFLVPKRQYPSDLDTQIIMGPGFQHRLILRMQEVRYDESDFVGQCVPSDEATTARFVNPYTGAQESFKYSKGACWYREVARVSLEMFNCSLWPMPIPWEYRGMRSCFNITADNSSSLQDKYTPQLLANVNDIRLNISNTARQKCERLKPCKTREYAYQHSLSRWPSDRVYSRGLKTLFKVYVKGEDNIPGIQYLVKNATLSQAEQSLISILFLSEDLLSSEIQFSKAYGFNSLVADIGGFFGLFIGASFLSFLEVIELIHNLVQLLWIRQRKVQSATSDEPQVSAAQN